MKSISFVSITNSKTLLVKEGSEFIECTFEGFQIQSTPLARWCLTNSLSKGIQCSFSKSKKIRYHNPNFFVDMIKSGALKAIYPDFEETKVFSGEEKNILKETTVDQSHCLTLGQQFNDFITNREILLKNFQKKQTFQNAQILSFGQQILMKIQFKEKPTLINVILKNIDHYFKILPLKNFQSFFSASPKFTINSERAKYNLAKQRYQIQVVLPLQMQLKMLEDGWGTVTTKNLISLNPQTLTKMRSAEKKARSNGVGIFRKPFEILSFIYSKNNIIGVIHEVLEGYIYKVRTKKEQIMKIELSMVYCPIANQIGAFECREFARKNLIGKQVNIFLKKDEGLNIHGSFARIVDNKDVESLILENGYGFVKEEIKGSLISAKFENLEKKAKEKKKGIHEQSSLGQRHFEDLTTTFSKKDKVRRKDALEDRLKVLRSLEIDEEGIIEKGLSANIYTIRINSLRKIIKVKLDGVRILKANPRLQQIQQLHQNINKFISQNLIQRTVLLEITDYEPNQNNYIGVLRLWRKGKEKKSIQEILLSEGFVFINKNSFYEESWTKCEEKADKQRKNIWGEKLYQLKKFQQRENIPNKFNGRFSWIKDGETAYVHPESSYQLIDELGGQLSKKMEPIDERDLVPGYICAAPYLGDYYRGKLLSISEKKVQIEFIDWGNKETLDRKSLLRLDDKLQYIPPLCYKVTLDLVHKFKSNLEHLEKVREFMMEGDCHFVTIYGNIVNVFREKQSLNMMLIEEGFLKADLEKIHDQKMKVRMMEMMDRLRIELVGIWDLEQGDDVYVSDDYDY